MTDGYRSIAIFASIAVALLIFLAVPGCSYVSAYNTANTFEQQVPAIYENNEQVLGQYGQKLQEAAQVPGMMASDYTKIFKDVMVGRYGPDGSKAVFQMLTEQNPQLSPKIYEQLQRIIEAGRDDFKAEQTKLVDVKRSYRTSLGSFWTGTFMSLAGFPKIKIGFPAGTEDAYPAITTARASKTFENGQEDGPIVLRSEPTSPPAEQKAPGAETQTPAKPQ